MSARADDLRFDRELLERHRPRLVYDPQTDYRVVSAATMVENEGNVLRRWDGEVLARAGEELSLELLGEYGRGALPADHLAAAPDLQGDARRMERDPRYADVVYGRVKLDGGLTWLQYWFWLYHNPKNLLGFGAHQGDWEMIQVGLGEDGEPRLATYAQHEHGEPRRWSGLRRHRAADGEHPIVYVAALSHASYFEDATHPYLFGIDHAYDNARPALLPRVEPFGRWVYWGGRWGDLAPVLGGRFGNGPQSPAHQSLKWDHPAAFHRQARRRAAERAGGRLLHAAGRATFPDAPLISAVTVEDERVIVRYELPERLVRRARHLYITIHGGAQQHVLASRILRRPPRSGTEEIHVWGALDPDRVVLASAFNRFRQRSEIAGHSPS